MRQCTTQAKLEGHWKLESWMLMKVARPVWGGAVGNGLLVDERVTPLVYHNTALAAYSTGGRSEKG
jgi:hypothetical protein